MKFPYRRYQVEAPADVVAPVVYRPVIPVRLAGPRGHIRLFALVDTGADHTLFRRWVANRVGIQVDDSKAADLVGFGDGRVPASPGALDIELSVDREAFHWTANVFFAPFPEVQAQLAILGHGGCLELFTATFDGDARTVELTPNATTESADS